MSAALSPIEIEALKIVAALVPEGLKGALMARARLEGRWSAAQDRADERIAALTWDWLVAGSDPILEDVAAVADAASAVRTLEQAGVL